MFHGYEKMGFDALRVLHRYLNGPIREPDLTIAPDGNPYLHRWYIVPRNTTGNLYLHMQVASDPHRPLHDHPWDNQSVILWGGYDELVEGDTPGTIRRIVVRKGDVRHRRADQLHRLILPEDIPFTISLFSTGPTIRAWGFQAYQRWVPAHEWIQDTRENETVISRTTQKGVFNVAHG